MGHRARNHIERAKRLREVLPTERAIAMPAVRFEGQTLTRVGQRHATSPCVRDNRQGPRIAMDAD